MRTTKRFVPKVLKRFAKEGRGIGIFESYSAWHKVGRGDPSSRGVSHIIKRNEQSQRQHDLLSDHERVSFLFILMVESLVDVREQFPLKTDEAKHEIGDYLRVDPSKLFPGTKSIARQLGLKHPMTYDVESSAEWVMTTDFLVAINDGEGEISLLAIAVKDQKELSVKRTCQLLKIEQEYWQARGVTWLLITPSLYSKKVGIFLKLQMPWFIGVRCTDAEMAVAVAMVNRFPERSLAFILDQLEIALSDDDLAKRAFWQAVLNRKITMSLNRGWRTHTPISLLSISDFIQQNPIASGRSAWI